MDTVSEQILKIIGAIFNEIATSIDADKAKKVMQSFEDLKPLIVNTIKENVQLKKNCDEYKKILIDVIDNKSVDVIAKYTSIDKDIIDHYNAVRALDAKHDAPNVPPQSNDDGHNDQNNDNNIDQNINGGQQQYLPSQPSMQNIQHYQGDQQMYRYPPPPQRARSQYNYFDKHTFENVNSYIPPSHPRSRGGMVTGTKPPMYPAPYIDDYYYAQEYDRPPMAPQHVDYNRTMIPPQQQYQSPVEPQILHQFTTPPPVKQVKKKFVSYNDFVMTTMRLFDGKLTEQENTYLYRYFQCFVENPLFEFNHIPAQHRTNFMKMYEAITGKKFNMDDMLQTIREGFTFTKSK